MVLTSTGATQSGNTIEVEKGSTVTYSVSKEGYITKTGTESNVTADKTIPIVLEAEPEPTPEPTEEPTEEPTPEPTQEPTEAPISSYSVTFNLVKGQGYGGSVQEVKLYIDNVLTVDPKDGPYWTADGDGYTYTHTFNDGNNHTYNIDAEYSSLFNNASGTVTPQTQTVNIEQIDK